MSFASSVAAAGNGPQTTAADTTSATAASTNSLRMSGLTIDFPFRPYPAQLALMDRLLKAVLNKQHALLESPTGSGKSVALLCSSLAWQAKEKAEVAKRFIEQQQYAAPYQPEASTEIDVDIPYDPFNTNAAQFSLTAPSASQLTYTNPEKKSTRNKPSTNPKAASSSSSSSSSTSVPKTPKIYFASRTHSQIQQLISELKSTSYRPTMSVLASRNQYCIHPDVSESNDKNDSCQKLLDFNECSYNRSVHRLVNRPDLHRDGKHVLWDIEELVALGKRHHACPYFASRTLADSTDTDIIFCPYNYLVDPMIAKSMGIDLEGAVVIIDESHNIEDVAINAASRELDLTNLRIASAELQRVLDTFTEGNDKIAHFRLVRDFVEHMIEWMQNVIAHMSFPGGAASSGPHNYIPSINVGVKVHTIFTGDECVNLLNSFSITPASLQGWLKSLEQVCAKPQENGIGGGDASADKLEPHITGIARSTLEAFGLVCEFIFSSNMKFVRDYRMVVKKELLQNINNKGNRTTDRSSRDYTYLLCFWCMNPAVAFQRLSSAARSVILTSGTLSPMNSFASELATSFPIRLEAPHVIDSSQVLAQVVSKGPNGVSLRGTFKSHEDCTYLDELGGIVESISARTPGGVLLFFPSYSMMDRVVTRWRDTKLYLRLMKYKEVVMEPRASGTKFDYAMEKFTKANEKFNEAQSSGQSSKQKSTKKPKRSRAKSGSNASDTGSPENGESEYGGTQVKFTSNGDPASSSSSSSHQLPVFITKGTAAKSQTGGMFLAVTRGKISEGIDFADFQARTVIVLGIPYPNSQDCRVMLKRSHNDQQKKASNDQLLTGSDWYSLQAYRTVNQAIGRAIRHKYDYGAIYLVDERYLEPKIQESLSKWVQTNLNRGGMPFAAIEEETEKFFRKWTASPPARPVPLVPTGILSTLTSNGSSSSNADPLAVQKTKMTQFFSASTPLPTVSNSSNFTGIVDAAGASSALPLPIDSDDEYSESDPKMETHAKQTEKPLRPKTEIAYESEEEIDLTSGAHPSLPAPAAAVTAAPSLEATTAKSTPISSDPPSHLRLSCKRCEHSLAHLPLVLTTSKPTTYQQSIEQKYFVQTVDAARRRLLSESISDDELASVSAMVCSIFALEPSADGNFGWIGYPSFTPEGLIMPDSLVKQFYNVWSEEDQICYQPLCCSACRSFVATQILVDRRDGSLNFEESCWIANDLIRIKPIAAARATVIVEPTQSTGAVLKPNHLQPEGRIENVSDAMQDDANDFPLPLSMPTLESAHQIAQTKKSPSHAAHGKRPHALLDASPPPQSVSLASAIGLNPLSDISFSTNNRTILSSSGNAHASDRPAMSNPPNKKTRRDEIIELDDDEEEQHQKRTVKVEPTKEAVSLRQLVSIPSDDMDDFLEERGNAVQKQLHSASILTTKPSSKTFTKKHTKRFV